MEKNEVETKDKGLLIVGIILSAMGFVPIGFIFIIIFIVKNANNGKATLTNEANLFIEESMENVKDHKNLSKCPNCGANINNKEKCEYCGTILKK